MSRRPSLFPASTPPPSHVFSSCSAVWSKHAGKREVSTARKSEATFPETKRRLRNRRMKWSRKYAHGVSALTLSARRKKRCCECGYLHSDVCLDALTLDLMTITTISSGSFFYCNSLAWTHGSLVQLLSTNFLTVKKTNFKSKMYLFSQITL